MKNGLVLIDCDGVMLDWLSIFDSWMAEGDCQIINSSKNKIFERYGLTKDAATEYVKNFNKSPDIAYLPPMPGARKYIRLLHFELGIKFRVITCIGENKNAFEMRKNNLRAVFGPAIDSVIPLPIKDTKENELTKYKDSGLFWIEDNIDNATVGYELGLKSVLMPNANKENFKFLEDCEHNLILIETWKEVYKFLSDISRISIDKQLSACYK